MKLGVRFASSLACYLFVRPSACVFATFAFVSLFRHLHQPGIGAGLVQAVGMRA